MVKLTWIEVWAISLMVAVIMVFFIEKIGFFIINSWFSIIFWIIIYAIISKIVVEVIKGKDEIEPIKELWKKQKIFDKVFIIVQIIAIIIFFIIVIGFVSDSFPYTSLDDNYNLKKIHIEMLEEDGYEVLYFDCQVYGIHNQIPDNTPILKMKSLGRRSEQVMSGLSSLAEVCPNASEYVIRILEEKQECFYFMDGEIYRGDDKYNQMNQMIESTSCS